MSPCSHSASATRSMIAFAIEKPSCSSRRGQEKRELVSSEPEGLAALAEARGDLREHAIADRMAEAVVDLLEVVDVEEAEGERDAASWASSRSRCSRSWKCRWFPSPVSGSVSARRMALSALYTERW